MAKTVTALYENYPTANSAVEDLVKHNFRREDISIMAQEALTKDDVRVPEEETSGAVTGVGVGAASVVLVAWSSAFRPLPFLGLDQ